jgi:hypothetical protein
MAPPTHSQIDWGKLPKAARRGRRGRRINRPPQSAERQTTTSSCGISGSECGERPRQQHPEVALRAFAGCRSRDIGAPGSVPVFLCPRSVRPSWRGVRPCEVSGKTRSHAVSLIAATPCDMLGTATNDASANVWQTRNPGRQRDIFASGTVNRASPRMQWAKADRLDV